VEPGQHRAFPDRQTRSGNEDAPLVYHEHTPGQRPDLRIGPVAPAQRRWLGEFKSPFGYGVGTADHRCGRRLVLDLFLMPVLGISFWARDRGFRQQAAALADAQDRAGPPPVSQPRDPYS